MHHSDLLRLDQRFTFGDYDIRAEELEKNAFHTEKHGESWSPLPEDGSVWGHLEAGESWRMAGNPDRAIEHLNAAERRLQEVETQHVTATVTEQMAATAMNDLFLPYVPSPAEGVFINYYKALAFWTTGRPDSARVELNRAEERIRRGVEHYEKEIEEAKVSAADVAHLRGQLPEMSRWRPYKDFVVPHVSYLHALFLAHTGDPRDLARARDLYGRLIELVDSNATVSADHADLEKGRLCPNGPCVWVILEEGLGPELVERRINLSNSSQDGRVAAFQIVLPMLASRTDVFPAGFTTVMIGGQKVAPAELSNVDRVIQTEFEKRFPLIVARSLASAADEIGGIVSIAEIVGGLAGPAATLFAMSKRAADLRIWRCLPARVSVVRARNTGKVSLSTQTGRPVSVDVPGDRDAIVFVKNPSDDLPPVVSVVPI